VSKLLRRLFSLAPASPKRITVPAPPRRWRLLQVEPALVCNLRCVMCPWKDIRRDIPDAGIMSPTVWNALRPHLKDVTSVDFTGGGEPLLQPRLAEWMAEAKAAGCETVVLTNGVLLSGEIAEGLISAGLDWLCVSIDAADKANYETIRQGSNFERVCDNLARVAAIRKGGVPKTMINFVIMSSNIGQVEDIVRLAARLGVDRINFKQCEVVRGVHGKGLGLFEPAESRAAIKSAKSLARALSLARKLGVSTSSYPFTPTELPVCEQDPRSSMFLRYDGLVAPCINCAYGGPTTFFGKEAVMPPVHYGRLPEIDLIEAWKSELSRSFRTSLEKRRREYENTFSESLLEDPLRPPDRIHEIAVKRMPSAPESCRVCHYLYGI
jgi:MoaA/NifB/PqqE/SkfB family radical SAM enzyme